MPDIDLPPTGAPGTPSAAPPSSAGSLHVDDWTEPGTFEVAPGVFRIPLPLPNDGLRAVNVYAVVDGDALVLVDSGWDIPGARVMLAEALARIDCGLGDIRRFLVTHAHRDHYTLGVAVRGEIGTPVHLGAGERPTVELLHRPGHRALSPQLQEMRRHGAGKLADLLEAELAASGGPERVEWELPDAWIPEGPMVLDAGRTLDVVETPGHTRGHVVFHDASAGLLFAGDHVLPRITPSIGFEPLPLQNPLGAFLGSLARVRAMPDALLLPAHGPVAPSVHARVDELVAHHDRRLSEIEHAVEAGESTAWEVANRIRWTRRDRRLVDLDVFNQILAVAETVAHLVLLEAQGRVVATEEPVASSGAPSPGTRAPTRSGDAMTAGSSSAESSSPQSFSALSPSAPSSGVESSGAESSGDVVALVRYHTV